MDGYGYTPIPPAEASCIIAHLFVELAPPCSCCKREDGVIVIQGTAYDGTGARITIKGETATTACAPLRWIARLINRPETAGEHCAPSSKEGVSLPHPAPYDRPGHG